MISLRDAFHHIHLSIHSTLDFNKIIRKVVVESAKATGCESSMMALCKGNLWTVKYTYGLLRELAAKSFTDEELPHAATAKTTRKPVSVNDTFNDNRVNRDIMKTLGIRSALAIPIIVRGKVTGTLLLHYHSAKVTFSETLIDFASKVSISASVALENARLYEDLMERQKELRVEKDLSDALIRINMLIHSTFDIDRIMKRVLREAAKAIGAESAILFILTEGEWEVRSVYKLPSKLPGKRFVGSELKHAELAIEMSAPLAVDNVAGDRRVNPEFASKLGIRSLLQLPFMTRCETKGGIGFHYHSGTAVFDRAHIKFAGRFADSLSLAFDNANSCNAVLRARNREGLLTDAMLNVIETFEQPFVVMGRDSRLIFYSHAFVELTGYGRDELKSIARLSDLTPPEWREQEKKVFGELERTGEPQVYQNECMRKDGSRIPVEIILHQALDTLGNTVYYYAFFTDIRERKKVEYELQQAQRDLKDYIAELEQHNKEFEIINNMNGLLLACKSVGGIYRVIDKYVRQLFAYDRGAVYVFDESRTVLETVLTWGDIRIEGHVLRPRDCRALRLGKSYSVDDPVNETLCPHIKPETGMAYICIPVTAKTRNIGLFHLQFTKYAGVPKEKAERLTAHKKHLASITAESISLSLLNFKLREAFFRQSILDPLTNLYNRRYMIATFERELHRMARKQGPLGVIMLDIDYFKQFNDTYGHEAGDILLQELSAFMRRSIREEDIACRYGGEEFVIILPESSLEASTHRAEQMRQEIKKLSFTYLNQNIGPITLSFGVAAFPDHGRRQEDILRAADAALYKAKEEGRDRVITAAT
ncbi:MAG: diguanylate cyclase [Nitrospirae bacterium]|nr:diguanylate cyclase [Nitrospirota bacterium]